MVADHLWSIIKLKNTSPYKRIYFFKKFSTREGDSDEKGAVQFFPNAAYFVTAIVLGWIEKRSRCCEGNAVPKEHTIVNINLLGRNYF
jgi:hypothetical protein